MDCKEKTHLLIFSIREGSMVHARRNAQSLDEMRQEILSKEFSVDIPIQLDRFRITRLKWDWVCCQVLTVDIMTHKINHR